MVITEHLLCKNGRRGTAFLTGNSAVHSGVDAPASHIAERPGAKTVPAVLQETP
jgi:hypothetical protein